MGKRCATEHTLQLQKYADRLQELPVHTPNGMESNNALTGLKDTPVWWKFTERDEDNETTSNLCYDLRVLPLFDWV